MDVLKLVARVPGLQEVTIRWRGSYGYLTAWAEGNDDAEQIPLCRIEYLDDDWGFAIYDPATETYTDAVLRTGDYAGNPTAVITHLAEYQQ